MKTYQFRLPFFKLSQHPAALIDEEGRKVGDVRRYFNRWWQWWADWVFHSWICHVQARDGEGRECADFREVVNTWKSWIRCTWNVVIEDGSGRRSEGVLTDRTVVRPRQRLLFERSDLKVEVERNWGDRTVRFRDGETGCLMAEARPEHLVWPHDVRLAVYDERLTAFEAACIYHLLCLKY
ncbi:hypothetical protein [Kyrpidia sp.]|uniref:tubby C-terminal domain-like protein n=1 Tax=Kyrpidia sp. TaxID=2073077 RepID=UPI0025826E24|nr:hypothetical protein [Kyrpidia sp.]MCL6577227.1 hypothetical protein [Kyrpidia sp.]